MATESALSQGLISLLFGRYYGKMGLGNPGIRCREPWGGCGSGPLNTYQPG
jgi:hypothetical protein